MNTIKDLAVQWWESLPIKRNKELLFKYHPDESLDYKKIENIFYNEVIIKWYVDKYGKIEFDYNEEEIKNIYLKEHSKEEPKDVILGYKTSLDAQMLDKVEPKQETIAEAAERILSKEGVKLHPSGLETYLKGNVINAMVEMVEWQAERMYSNMEEYSAFVLKSYKERLPLLLAKDWFEQFKKK